MKGSFISSRKRKHVQNAVGEGGSARTQKIRVSYDQVHTSKIHPCTNKHESTVSDILVNTLPIPTIDTHSNNGITHIKG